MAGAGARGGRERSLEWKERGTWIRGCSRSYLPCPHTPLPRSPCRYLGPDLGAATGAQAHRSDLTPASLPAVSARHFPLCMHGLMTALHKEHHLRHNGRQQLSLFLKV